MLFFFPFEHESLVLKPNHRLLGQSFDFLVQEGTSPGALHELRRNILNTRARFASRFIELRKYFEPSAPIPTKFYVMNMPLNWDILGDFFERKLEGEKVANWKNLLKNKLSSIPVLVANQRNIDSNNYDVGFSISRYYLDMDERVTLEARAEIDRVLIYGDTTSLNESFMTTFGETYLTEDLGEIFLRNQQDLNFRECIMRFLDGAARFSQSKNTHLDIANYLNAFIAKDSSGTWHYRLLDVLEPEDLSPYYSKISRVKENIRRFISSPDYKLSDWDLCELRNCLGYVRLFNALSLQTNHGAFIDIIDPQVKGNIVPLPV